MSQNNDVLDIDFKDVPDAGGPSLPAGTYEAKVFNVEVDSDTKDGVDRTFIAIQFVIAEGPFEGTQTRKERIYIPNANFRLKQLLNCLGYDTKLRHNVRQMIADQAWIGKPIKIVLKETPGTKEGQVFTNLDSFAPSDNAAGNTGGGTPNNSGGAALPGLPGM